MEAKQPWLGLQPLSAPSAANRHLPPLRFPCIGDHGTNCHLPPLRFPFDWGSLHQLSSSCPFAFPLIGDHRTVRGLPFCRCMAVRITGRIGRLGRVGRRAGRQVGRRIGRCAGRHDWQVWQVRRQAGGADLAGTQAGALCPPCRGGPPRSEVEGFHLYL